MTNIIDYLKERKNIPFAQEPFNEVDGLVLSQVIYTDFDAILNEDSYADIADVNEQFWAQHTEEEIMASASFTKLAPFLMKEMADSVRYEGIKFKNYVSTISLETIKQFGAVTFELPDGSDFISYRGTNGTVAGWMEDFKFSYSTTEGQDDAVNYINRFHKGNQRPIRIGGHSKGGNLGVYAAIFCARDIQDKIDRVFSYDGPGFKMDVLESEEYKRILPRVLSVIPKDCAVGIMMNNYYNTIITDSDERAIRQHDAFQWHIDGNRFEELESRSELSLFFEKVLNNWMGRCDAGKREQILETALTLIMDNDLATDGTPLTMEFFHTFLSNSKKLEHSERVLMLSSLSDIFVSTSVVTADEMKAKAGPIAEDLKAKSIAVAEDVKVKSVTVAEEVKTKAIPLAEEVKEKSVSFIDELKEKAVPLAEDIKTKSVTVAEEIAEDFKTKSTSIKEKLAARKKETAEDGEETETEAETEE